ncbi:MAG: hypothetical protein H6719_20215 [Sandaracinaceae bacterium]|nr:hypothetical protein [Sandaracinaceae bacterium]
MKRALPYVAALAPSLTLVAIALVRDGPRPEGASLLSLLVIGGLALAFVLATLERSARSTGWLAGALAACAAVLAVPLVAALFADPTYVDHIDPARLDEVAALATDGAWAPLIASALAAGLAMGLGALAAGQRRPGAWATAFVAAVLTVPVPLIVVWSAWGHGPLYSALRWGPVAWSMVAVVLASAGAREQRAVGHTYAVYVVAATLGVLAAFAFIEVPVLWAASSVDLLSHRAMLDGAGRLEATTFGWRLPLVPLASLLPLAVLGDLGVRERLRSLAVVGVLLAGCALTHASTSEVLDGVAERATHDWTRGALVVRGDEDGASVRAHVVERDGVRRVFAVVDGDPEARLTRLVRAAHEEDVGLVLLSRAETPEIRALLDTMDRIAPHLGRELDTQRCAWLTVDVRGSCDDLLDASAPCWSLEDTVSGDVVELGRRAGSGQLVLVDPTLVAAGR